MILNSIKQVIDKNLYDKLLSDIIKNCLVFFNFTIFLRILMNLMNFQKEFPIIQNLKD